MNSNVSWSLRNTAPETQIGRADHTVSGMIAAFVVLHSLRLMQSSLLQLLGSNVVVRAAQQASDLAKPG